jgi:uncharacterized protein
MVYEQLNLLSDFIILISSPIIISAFFSYLFAHIIKFITLEDRTLKNFIVNHGGMPSSHTAVVFSIITSIYLIEGITTLLIFSVLFAIIVTNDAVNSRFQIGEQGKFLNQKFHTHFKERVGHKLIEVFCGAILGIVIGIIVSLII